MLAEIRKQPDVLRELRRRALEEWVLPKSLFRGVSSAVAFGSGSSFHVALMARDYLESIAGIPARAVHASEAFRYALPGRGRTLAIGFSHSGSSTDVRSALKRAKRRGARTLALTNIEGSPMTRDADAALVTGAGVEKAIPSTKGFTALAAAAYLLASLQAGSLKRAARVIARAARAMEDVAIPEELVGRVAASKAAVFLGDGLLHPVALDGALKLLEVAQIPALAYPKAEFRHGPKALVEPGVIVVELDNLPGAAQPVVRAAQLQLLAHDVGVRLGRDVDRPRGLTKIVR